jgi:uncharacterized protein (DUF2235 family)
MPKKHIIIIDGTQSRLHRGQETNAGLLYKLLLEHDKTVWPRHIWYDPGIQGHGFWNWVTIASGKGINRMIRNAYAALCSKYRQGDQIFLFGFSRGAYAVRSLSGLINTVGLLRHEEATERNINQAFRLYELDRPAEIKAGFQERHCEPNVTIEMIGVWDTVKTLGLPYPLLSRLAPMATEFHSDNIGGPVKHGYHALALNEDRQAYRPVLWHSQNGWTGHLEQVWFRGAHADIGGHVWSVPAARGLSNIPLVWMLERAEKCGLSLPRSWRDRYPCDVNAPSVGTHRGIAKFFLLRQKREQGGAPGEFLHYSVLQHDQYAQYGIPVQQPEECDKQV